MKIIFVICFFMGTIGLAKRGVQFKNFSGLRKVGEWESVTKLMSGPQKGKAVTQKICITEDDVKNGKAQASAISEAMPNCETKISLDSNDIAASEQTCKIGARSTIMKIKLSKTGTDSFRTETESNFGGAITQTVSETHFTGACTAATKKERDSTATCSECKTEIQKMKKACDENPEAAKIQCLNMSKQVEAMCKTRCG